MPLITLVRVNNGIPDYAAGGGIQFYSDTYPLSDGNFVGRYHGPVALPPYVGPYPPPQTAYKTALNPGEVLVLLGATAYGSVYKAAYPTDGAPADAQALFFLESAKHPYSANGLIDVNVPPVTDAMAYFVAVGYISQADADRVTQGKPL